MKEALISPIEPREYQTGWDESVIPPQPIYTSGCRVAQVEPEGQTFPVAEPLFWTECADDVEQDSWFYVTDTQQIVPVPPVPFPEPNVSANVAQPISQGTETL